MHKTIIITGGNKGLGKALIDEFIKMDNTLIFSISRNIHSDHQTLASSVFQCIPTDLSKPFNSVKFEVLKQTLSKSQKIIVLNNASIITPISNIGTFQKNNINTAIHTNIVFPTTFINYLIRNISKKTNTSFVNISSGCAKRTIASWALYCSSKAYMEMYIETAKEENKLNENWKFMSYDPGVLNTQMQSQIRNSVFDNSQYFNELHTNNKLVEPHEAAKKLIKLFNL